MADFNQPALTSLYADMVNVLKDRDISALKWLDGTTDSNIPSGAKRWNTTNSYFEKFNGSTWSALTAKYMIDVDKVDGCIVNDLGTSTTDLWTASKVNTALSTKLDASAYTAADVLTKIKTVDGSASGLDADLLDGLHASSSNTGSTVVARDASGNFSAGTITANLTGTASTASTATLATKASTLALGGGNNAGGTFHWSGQAGQPAGLWGGNDGTNMYVYNPSNFSVNYADSAGSATTATTASSANQLNGRNFYWSGQGGQPAWLWGGNDGTNMYVYNPSNFSVNYANSAGYATTAAVGTNTTQIATTAFVLANAIRTADFVRSLAVNGYQKLPGGLIIQWGKTGAVSSGATVTVTFPIAFTITTPVVTCNADYSGTGNNYQAKPEGTTATTVTIRVGNATADSVHWIAIGY